MAERSNDLVFDAFAHLIPENSSIKPSTGSVSSGNPDPVMAAFADLIPANSGLNQRPAETRFPTETQLPAETERQPRSVLGHAMAGALGAFAPRPDGAGRRAPTWFNAFVGQPLGDFALRQDANISGMAADAGVRLHNNRFLNPFDTYLDRANNLGKDLARDPANQELRTTIQGYGVNPDDLLSDDFRTQLAARETISEGMKTTGVAGNDFIQGAIARGAEKRQELQDRAMDIDPWSGKGFVSTILSSSVDMIPGIVAGAATRSPGVSSGFIGAQVYGNTFIEGVTEKGLTIEQAQTRATFMAASELIPEMIPMNLLLKSGGTMIKRMLGTAGAEAVQEAFTEIMQQGYDINALGEDWTWGEFASDVLYSGLVGAGAGATLAGITEPFQRGVGSETGVVPPSEPAADMNGVDVSRLSDDLTQEVGIPEFDSADLGAIEPIPFEGETDLLQPGQIQEITAADFGGQPAETADSNAIETDVTDVTDVTDSEAETETAAPAAREQEAREAGFNTEEVFYHGTVADVKEFDRNGESNFKYGDQPDSGGIFFSPNAESVSAYQEGAAGFESGSNTIPVYLNLGNKIADVEMDPLSSLEKQAEKLRQLESEGYTAARFPDGEVAVFNPDQIRSVFAEEPQIPDIEREAPPDSEYTPEQEVANLDTAITDKQREIRESKKDNGGKYELAHYVAQQGGISIEEAKAEGVMDQNQRTNGGWIFRKNGVNFDQMAEGLNQLGFQFETANDLVKALRESVNGQAETILPGRENIANLGKELIELEEMRGQAAQALPEGTVETVVEGAPVADPTLTPVVETQQRSEQAVEEQLSQEEFELAQPTEESLKAAEAKKVEAEAKETAQAKKAVADEQVSEFGLTGSNSAVDQAEAAGQNNLFDPNSTETRTVAERNIDDADTAAEAAGQDSLFGSRVSPEKRAELRDNAREASLAMDGKANEAATSPENDLPQPSEAQIEAGNYKKGHVSFQGMDIAIENPAGSTREGVSDNGVKWSTKMNNHYGYIKKTNGNDGDQVDAFIGPLQDSESVYVVNQEKTPGIFDEHKVMLGFEGLRQAKRAYKSNYNKGFKVGPVTEMTMAEFKDWLENGDTTKPAVVNSTPLNEIQLTDSLEVEDTGEVVEVTQSAETLLANIDKRIDAIKSVLSCVKG